MTYQVTQCLGPLMFSVVSATSSKLVSTIRGKRFNIAYDCTPTQLLKLMIQTHLHAVSFCNIFYKICFPWMIHLIHETKIATLCLVTPGKSEFTFLLVLLFLLMLLLILCFCFENYEYLPVTDSLKLRIKWQARKK